ncbi:glycoside hydrolase family 95 protein [Bacteroides ovatus]|uniref:glycoside hydrolase family 95 protein n=1 Tax=Bacteroides ovatus TaxID=28116 RepID=UPI003144E8AB
MKTRLFLLFIMCLFILPSASAQQKEYSLWYSQPAPNEGAENIVKSRGFPYDKYWERWSLPIGNGYMGACIFGRTDTERIQLTEKTFGVKGPYKKGGIGNFAEIYIEDIHHDQPLNYKRSLRLNDAISTVNYQYEGVNYTREYFANYPSNVIVVKLKADQPGKISFTLRPVLPYLHEYNDEGTGRTGKVSAQNDLITLTGDIQFFRLPYEAQIKVIPSGGQLKAMNDESGNNGTIRIQQADSVVLLINAQTAYQLKSSVFTASPENKFTGNEHPHRAVSQCIQKAADKGYEVLCKEHIADYQSLFSRVDLRLCDETPGIPTDSLLHDYQRGKESLYMDELLFQYGRYLLIASSRKGSLPPHLQGAWSQYEYAPWSGGYWHNINIQMNYWAAFNTNLAEVFIPYVEYNEAFRQSANEKATGYIKKNNPDALSAIPEENGWTIGTGANAFSIDSPGGHSGPGTGGFTTKLFWDYYDFTRDEDILKKHSYPAMLGMAKFLSKTLKPTEEGYLLADPSSSPEQYHNGTTYQTKGCAFDQEMIWESFHDALKAADILKEESPFLRTIKEQIGKLDAIQIGESGQIKEYREEKKYSDIGDPRHRHISHLCALYPGTLINAETPEWLKAATVTLNNRGDKSTGWGVAHRLNLWARVKDGDMAYQRFQLLLKKYILENLWNMHPPFQIDGNLGGTAGVAEMLIQSHEGYINPLPALPAAWRDGSYEGLVARGNFVVSVFWKQGLMTQMNILSRAGGECVIQYKDIANFTIKDAKGKKVKTIRESKNRIRFATQKGNTYYLNH